MSNYFERMQLRLDAYRDVYRYRPRIAIAKMLVWNAFYFLKIPKDSESENPIKDQSPKRLISGRRFSSEKRQSHEMLSIAFAEGGGVGDDILDAQLLKEIKKLVPGTVMIDFYCRAHKLFASYPFIDHTYDFSSNIDKEAYDLILYGHRLILINHINEEKVKRFSRTLYDYCIDCRKMQEQDFANQMNDNLISQYALMKGKKRIEQCNINDLLPLNRNTPKYMSLDSNEFGILEQYGLLHETYIVVNRAVDGKYNSNHPKLWPLDSYNRLVRRLKQEYPDIKIVLVGDSEKFDPISLVDVNLIGKTNLEQCKVLLKYAALLIAGEGGLVHMKNFLNGTSVVVFGPTVPEIFGYDENINLRTNACERTCEWVSDKWAEKCMLGYEKPKCIHSVSVESVFDAVCTKLRERSSWKYEITRYLKTVKDLMELIYTDYLPTCGKAAWKICLLGNINSSQELQLAERSSGLDIFIEQDVPKERCYGITEEYGNAYNLPARDEKYGLVLSFHKGKDANLYFGLKELLRITADGGYMITAIHKANISNAVDAFSELGVQVDIGRLQLNQSAVLVVRKERAK